MQDSSVFELDTQIFLTELLLDASKCTIVFVPFQKGALRVCKTSFSGAGDFGGNLEDREKHPRHLAHVAHG